MFRKCLKGCQLYEADPCFSEVFETSSYIDEVGDVKMKSVYRQVKNTDVELPPADLFTLRALMDANIPLERVNPAVLNPSDLVTIEDRNREVVNRWLDSMNVQEIEVSE